MGKKNLEQLFRDTFKGFHEKPDDGVWKSIEDTLDKRKQKKRVIPIWWRLGGVAALLAILFYIVNPFGDTPSNETNTPVITDTETHEKSSETNDSLITDTEVVDENNDGRLNDPGMQPKPLDASNEIENSLAESEERDDDYEKLDSNKKTIPNTVITEVDKNEAPIPQDKRQQKQDFVDSKVEDKEAVAQNDSKQEDVPNKSNLDSNRILQEEKSEVAVLDQQERTENQKEERPTPNLLDKNAVDNQLKKEAVAQTETEEIEDKKEEESEKKSIFDAIAEQNAEEEEELIAENSGAKWSVGPSVAPVYFNGSGEGSPIHSNFSSNSKSGNVNLSYGLTVAYDLGKRLKVRSGVHRVDFGYDTNEIVFSSSIESSTNALIDNINYSQTSRNLVVQSKRSVPSAAADNAFVELSSTETPGLDGKMVQQLGYIEIPLELNYALIDRKFGVDVIGGVSSLFLVDNTVLLESDELITEMGEANNANSVNFSTNVGIGLNYEFSPKVQLNLEPMFKYQLNTFSETAGPFRPFSVGVYSGVSFKF